MFLTDGASQLTQYPTPFGFIYYSYYPSHGTFLGHDIVHRISLSFYLKTQFRGRGVEDLLN